MEPTLTLESDHMGSLCDDDEEAPDLPVDSRHTTPAHSSRENSRESTPISKRRKNMSDNCSQLITKTTSPSKKVTSTTSLKARELDMENLRSYQALIPSLDESLENDKSHGNNDVESLSHINASICDTCSSQPSGYKSDDFLASTSTGVNETPAQRSSPTLSQKSNASTSSRQRRLEDLDRFKTHTICKGDLSAQTNSGMSTPLIGNSVLSGKKYHVMTQLQKQSLQISSIKDNDLKLVESGSESDSSQMRSSTKSIKQRRTEKAEIFKTHTINASDIRKEIEVKENNELNFLEVEAKLVVEAIREGKESARSRSSSTDVLGNKINNCDRSRSISIEILDDYSLQNQQFDAGRCNSTLERNKLKAAVEDSQNQRCGGPRICKPWESEQYEDHETDERIHAVRGKRKPLYSTHPKSQNRSTIPPSIPPTKPTIAPKPRNIISGQANEGVLVRIFLLLKQNQLDPLPPKSGTQGLLTCVK